MADVVHSSRSYIAPYRTRSGSVRLQYYQESTAASTAVIAYGNVVSGDIDTSSATHRIVRCSTASGQTPILSTSIVGVAAEGSTSDGSTTGLSVATNRLIGVYVADANTEFKFPTKVLIASTLVGGAGMELSWDSTLNIHHASANSTAGDCRILVTDLLPNTIGDTGGWVIGRFFSTAVMPHVQPR